MPVMVILSKLGTLLSIAALIKMTRISWYVLGEDLSPGKIWSLNSLMMKMGINPWPNLPLWPLTIQPNCKTQMMTVSRMLRTYALQIPGNPLLVYAGVDCRIQTVMGMARPIVRMLTRKIPPRPNLNPLKMRKPRKIRMKTGHRTARINVRRIQKKLSLENAAVEHLMRMGMKTGLLTAMIDARPSPMKIRLVTPATKMRIMTACLMARINVLMIPSNSKRVIVDVASQKRTRIRMVPLTARTSALKIQRRSNLENLAVMTSVVWIQTKTVHRIVRIVVQKMKTKSNLVTAAVVSQRLTAMKTNIRTASMNVISTLIRNIRDSVAVENQKQIQTGTENLIV